MTNSFPTSLVHVGVIYALQVYVESLTREDLLHITTRMYPQLPIDMLAKMVDFNEQVTYDTEII